MGSSDITATTREIEVEYMKRLEVEELEREVHCTAC